MQKEDRRGKAPLAKWAVAVWIVCLVVVSVRVAVRPGAGSVYPCYAEAGHRWLVGEPVYQDSNGYRYCPPVTPLFAALSVLPNSVAEVIWRLLSAAVFLGGLACWTRCLPADLKRAEMALLFVLVLPLSLGSLNNGQANLMVTGLLVGGMAAAFHQRWNLTAGCLAAACLLKVYPVAIALLLLALYPRKLSLRLGVALVMGLALPFLFHSPHRGMDEYRAWLSNLANDDRTSWPLEYAYRDLWQLCRLWHVPMNREGYLALQLLSAAGIAVVCLAGQRSGWSVRQVLVTLLSLGTAWMMLFGPATESSTFVMLTPALAWATLESWIAGESVLVRAGLAVSYGLFLAAAMVAWFPFVLRAHALGFHPLATLVFFVVSLTSALTRLRWSSVSRDVGIVEIQAQAA